MVHFMSQLPPDPLRLRAILAHIDRQIAEHQTVAVYLRLQRDAVLAALADSEGRRAQRPARRPKGGGHLPALAPPSAREVDFVVQQKRTPTGPAPAVIHLDDCTMAEGTPHRIRADEARAALTDPSIEPCQLCRPDTELGVDVA
ncbi:conserved hypothetical protein [Streptomyces scabiei 87.22]|uniref:Uncharacterized protein n=5 Tax=Streptomyces TaxID=1883 RepID=C9ZDJ4_STRSW|nr:MULTISPECIES: DUF6233 domain-containing protein [Streptomyces]KFG02893.1 hypothetical protein IQ61_43805 [Streptomyces scabiei]CBG70353.1 conserved hypothetical protein [Streptomyces scabiei 87.22]